MLDPYKIIGWAWVAIAVLWLVTSFTSKRTIRKQSAGSRLVQLCLWVAVILLLWGQGLGNIARDWALIPRVPASADTGLVLTIAGLAVAIWARFALGRNWSANVTLKQDHELVRSGPYAAVRHPIYSGILLALLGTAIARGDVGALVALAIAALALHLKSRTEESFMADQFGSQYTEYKRDVKALIPFVW